MRVSTLVACILSVSTAWAGLFDADFHVASLDQGSLTKTVIAGTGQWMVLFYAPWCGHCQHYAPTWRQIGDQLVGSPVRIGAVDCVISRDTCGAHGVKSFPTIKTWRIVDSPIGLAHEEQTNTSSTLDKFGAAVVDPKEREHVMNWLTARMEPDFAATYHITDKATGEESSESEEEGAIEVAESTAQLRKQTAVQRLHDAALALVFGLNEIPFPIKEPASHAAYIAWLKMLSRTFPGEIPRQMLQQLFEAAAEAGSSEDGTLISNWKFGSVKDGVHCIGLQDCEGATSLKYEASMLMMSPASAGAVGAKTLWQACGPARDKGYPCALWTLLHILMAHTQCPHAPPITVVHAAREFLRHHFQCEECREHFLNETKDAVNSFGCESPTARRDAMIWLWKVHNSVNLRLHNGNPKALWPPNEVCSGCRLNHKDADTEWDEHAVVRFLEDGYCDEHARCKPPVQHGGGMGELTKLGLLLACFGAVILGSCILVNKMNLESFYNKKD